jgi:hypothetical protein
VRDFRLLWLGEAISTLGDQFTLRAYPTAEAAPAT